MAVQSGMFLFEVVLMNVQSLNPSRNLIVRGDFADVFSLELKDPKNLRITLPEPPVEPVKPGKKKAKPKPKKGKKGKQVEPPAPKIEAGQSVLFCSTPEFLITSMEKFPLQISLWCKEERYVYIGSACLTWDPEYPQYLMKICRDNIVPPPVSIENEYNIFEENTAVRIAKIELQVKLTYLTDKVTTSFRTLGEDNVIKKVLYTGLNSRTTSFMCHIKTPEELLRENLNKVENNYTIDKETSKKGNKLVYASFKNAPGTHFPFTEGDICCMNKADKPPDGGHKPFETCPDIDFIIDYVRQIIISCNENMRTLTPRPEIRPRVKATDLDRLCFCNETEWPQGELAERFRKAVQSEPCAICSDVATAPKGIGKTYDIANLRGPCGSIDCKIARRLRTYIEDLIEQDNKIFNFSELVGPCGSKECTLVEQLVEFLRGEGEFSKDEATLKGLSTQCDCLGKMVNAVVKKPSCTGCCVSRTCDDASVSFCGEGKCPYTEVSNSNVYATYYFTVQYDFEKDLTSEPGSAQSSKYKFCPSTCPSAKESAEDVCSQSCKIHRPKDNKSDKVPLSPADSNIIIDFKEITNPCDVKSCDMANHIKHIISGAIEHTPCNPEETCYCDCDCFKESPTNETTYCPVCSGYQLIGDDLADMPLYRKPHPCPVYHKMYNRESYKITRKAWPDEDEKELKKKESSSGKKRGLERSIPSETGSEADDIPLKRRDKKPKTKQPSPKQKSSKQQSSKQESSKQESPKQQSKEKPQKKVGKFTANVEKKPKKSKKPTNPHQYPLVPGNMGWNWVAKDIPGLEFAKGWRPGAISKSLLRKLNKAKTKTLPVEQVKIPKKVTKKRAKDKPTLIISKINGEFRIEMQASPESDNNDEQFSPLIYKIKTEDNDEKVQKYERRKQHLIKKAIDKVWKDPYHPEICEKTCLRAYKQAVGLLPYDPENPECICSNEKVNTQHQSSSSVTFNSSHDSSLDVQWEIHFTPPSAYNKIVE